MLSIIFVALLPVLVLAGFIVYKDRHQPEPTSLLLRAFGLGMLSVIPTMLLGNIFYAMGLVPEPLQEQFFQSEWDAIHYSFWAAAIPEELAKFGMLWLVLRRNPHFDEKMDGIVYAACVALGFAALENLMYLFLNPEEYLQVGVSRAVSAVPGHFCMGVLMGYYYSLARFCSHARWRHGILILAAPMLAHGVYDSFLFVAAASTELLCLILNLLFPIFCILLWRYASRRITDHLVADGVLTR